MKIFLDTCGHYEKAWCYQYEQFAKLAAIAEPRLHTVVDSAEEADLIIITDVADTDRFAPERNRFLTLREHPLVHRYPDRTFAYCDGDRPIPFVRGVYVSARQSRWHLGRVASAMYVSEWENEQVGMATDQRDLLFSFLGRSGVPVRQRLLEHDWRRPDVMVQDTTPYRLWMDGHDRRRQWDYAETSRRSKFVICPRGAGAATMRLFEVMQMGVAPVVLSDRWLLPAGPRWNDFAVLVPECDVDRLDHILEGYGDRWRQMGRLARQEWLRWFSPPRRFNYIVDQMVAIGERAVVPERLVHRLWPAMVAADRARGFRQKMKRRGDQPGFETDDAGVQEHPDSPVDGSQ